MDTNAPDILVNLLEHEPPYKKIAITLDDYQAISSCETIKIECYCQHCQKTQTFAQPKGSAIFRELKKTAMEHNPGPDGIRTLARVPVIPMPSRPDDDPDTYGTIFVSFPVCCAYCNETHYFCLKISGKDMCKIGQYPSFSRAETADYRRYKNFISKYYVELTSAVNAYSQGMGIGAFVYLRRIIEYLVDNKYRRLLDKKEEIKFIDKLKAVEDSGEKIIPDLLTEIKGQIYTILSKGIHEYEESECLNLFDAVLFVVTSILDEELYKKEQAEKVKQVKKEISKKLSKG